VVGLEVIVRVPPLLQLDEPSIVVAVGFPHALFRFVPVQAVDVDPSSRVQLHRVVGDLRLAEHSASGSGRKKCQPSPFLQCWLILIRGALVIAQTRS